jgi:hypothetical protein
MTTENNTSETNENVDPKQEEAVVALANQILARVNLSEALSLISMNAVLQLVQNKVLEQARTEVEKMDDDQIEDLLNPPAETEDVEDDSEEADEEASSEDS